MFQIYCFQGDMNWYISERRTENVVSLKESNWSVIKQFKWHLFVKLKYASIKKKKKTLHAEFHWHKLCSMLSFIPKFHSAVYSLSLLIYICKVVNVLCSMMYLMYVYSKLIIHVISWNYLDKKKALSWNNKLVKWKGSPYCLFAEYEKACYDGLLLLKLVSKFDRLYW